MFTKSSIYLLFSLSLMVLGLEDSRENPVDVLEVKDLLVENYNGPLKIETLELFRNIKYLQFRNSNFTTFQWNFLSILPNLKSLELAKNVIQKVDYNITKCCNNLEILELTESGFPELPDFLLKKIGALESLKHLSLRDEKIQTLRKDILTNPNLEHLTLLACHLETIEDGAFENLQKLETLDLSYNSIKEIKRESFASLRNVKRIILKGNFLEKLTTDMIPALPNLEMMDVGHNLIVKFDLEGVKSVAPKLRIVDVRGLNLIEPKSGGVELFKDPFANF